MKLLFWAGIGLLLALGGAALHDILKGNEPGYLSEYTTLGASLVIFAGILLRLRKRRGPA